MLHIECSHFGYIVLTDLKESLLLNAGQGKGEEALIVGDVSNTTLLNQPGHKLKPGDPAVLHVIYGRCELLDLASSLPQDSPQLFLE
jgi:hypothetical protein